MALSYISSMVKRKALGSGLEALLSKKPAEDISEKMSSSESDIDSQIRAIPIEKICPLLMHCPL